MRYLKKKDQNKRALTDTSKLKVFIWHLELIYDKPYLSDSIPLIITDTAGRTKVTESLRQEVVQMKAKGMTLSPTAREVSCSKFDFANTAALL